MSEPRDVTDRDFQTAVLEADTPVIVDFWAEWCAPCRAIAPILSQLAQTYAGRITVAKVNVEENPATAAQYGVRAIPTVLALRDGQVVDQINGARPAAVFDEFAQKLLS